MLRDARRLQAAAIRVQQDLRQTVDDDVNCSIDGEYVMTVRWRSRVESVALIEHVEDEAWFLDPAAPIDEQAAALDADADEVLAGEVQEVLRLWGMRWPACPQHRRVMICCSGDWLCEGPPTHAAHVGALVALTT